MLEEQKTLNDIDKDFITSPKALRREAIKWVKTFRSDDKFFQAPETWPEVFKKCCSKENGFKEVEEFIKYFFNLREEDLK